MTQSFGGLSLPAYFKYHKSPVKMVGTPEGGLMTWRLDPDTGGWEPANDIVDDILFAVGGEVDQVSRDNFVQHVEEERGLYLDGDGPIFALYETINAIEDVADKAGRDLTRTELAMVKGLRRRTYAMFEADLARQGDPGADLEADRAEGGGGRE